MEFAACHVGGNTKHIAECNQDDAVGCRQLDGGKDIFLGANPDRTTGTGDQLDAVWQHIAQPRHADAPLMTTADIQDPHWP